MSSAEYDYYRDLYCKSISIGEVPWKPAYYYYTLHTQDKNLKTFLEFKERIQLKALSSKNQQLEVLGPMYVELDMYYSPVEVIQNGRVIKIV